MIGQALRRVVWDRAAGACEYCRVPSAHVPSPPFHVEHVIPRKHGGADHKENLALAWVLNGRQLTDSAAEVAFYWCLVARIEGRAAAPGLGRLRFQLAQSDFRRVSPSLRALDAAMERIPQEEVSFYSALADAILHAEKVSDLEEFRAWKDVQPIPLDKDWDMSA